MKHKYHLSGTHRASSESSPTPHVAKWSFVISGDESALDQPALSWSAVKLQTNWFIELVFLYSDGEPNHPQISPACSQPSHLPSDREFADVEIANPGTPDISNHLKPYRAPVPIKYRLALSRTD